MDGVGVGVVRERAIRAFEEGGKVVGAHGVASLKDAIDGFARLGLHEVVVEELAGVGLHPTHPAAGWKGNGR